MQAWLRLLIVWCIAIALPVQGMAGVTMAHCGALHARMVMATQAGQHQHMNQYMDQHMDHGAGVAHHHGASMAGAATPADHAPASQAQAQAQAQTHAQTHAQAQPDKLADAAQAKCSACAACCAGSALPSAAWRIAGVATAPAVFADSVCTVDPYATGGPDRPPRCHPV